MYWILDECNNVYECIDTLEEAQELFEESYNRKGYRIEQSRNFYEVALMKHVEGSCDDDYETKEFMEAENYIEAVKVAKQKSTTWDACTVICYTWTEDTSYEEIYKEQYINGKQYRRWDCGQ